MVSFRVDTEKIKELSKVVVAKGCAITSITHLPGDPSSSNKALAKTLLLVNCNDNSVRLYFVQADGALAFLKQQFVAQGNLPITSCGCPLSMSNIFGLGGRFVASGSEDGDVHVFDTSTQQLQVRDRLVVVGPFLLRVACPVRLPPPPTRSSHARRPLRARDDFFGRTDWRLLTHSLDFGPFRRRRSTSFAATRAPCSP